MRIASGMSATDGIGRRNSTVVCVARRRNGTSPMTVPSTTASTVAIDEADRPRRQRAADVAPELEVAQLHGQLRERRRSPVGKYAGSTMPSVGKQLPGDEEAEDAGDAERDLAQRPARAATRAATRRGGGVNDDHGVVIRSVLSAAGADGRGTGCRDPRHPVLRFVYCCWIIRS